MKTRHAAVVSFLTATLASNPCQRLCDSDGSSVCTNGSWPRGDVCHAYFRVNDDEHCYHNAETRETCPDTLPQLTLVQAEAILVSRAGPQHERRRVVPLASASVEATTTIEPLTTDSTTEATTDLTTEAATELPATRAVHRRRVVPVASASTEPTTTIEPFTTETTTITPPGQPARRRRVFPVSQTVVPTPAPSDAVEEITTEAPGPARRRRVFPVGQVGAVPNRPLTTGPPVIRHYQTPTVSPHYAGYGSPFFPSMSTPVAAADYIGAAFERRFDFGGLTRAIANALSRPSASTWPAAVSDDDAMDFWTRAHGADLLAHAIARPNCGEVVDTECFALMLLISHMPLPNTDESSALLFLERIGVMAFVEQNIDQLRHRLSVSGGNLYYNYGYEMDGRTNAIYRAFARNWPIRFPQIVGDSTLARSMVLRHRIFGYHYLSSPTSSYGESVHLDVNRRDALDTTGTQLSRYDAASLRRGVLSVRYTGESAGGQGLTNEFFSLVASSVVGNSPTALFATHPDSGFERISAGADEANLARYRTLGRFFALCVVSGNPTGIPLPAMFFRRLLGQTVSLDDVEIFDEDWVRGARFFARATNQVELDQYVAGGSLPGSGSDAPLTMENRDDMMQRAIENIITNNSPAQFAAIAEGFFYVLPRELFDGIAGEDLESMIVGNLDVSAADLIANIRFDDVSPDRQQWLVNIINGFTAAQRRLFLRFVTGYSVVPATGWAGLTMRVSSATRMSDNGRYVRMPRSQTCFKAMYLPNYESEEEMRTILINVLEQAIDAGMQER